MTLLHTLKITDGTNVIDLLSKRQLYGWHMDDATMNFPTMKGDGTWQDSPLIDGRNLSNYALTNANDIYEVTLKASSADIFNSRLNDLRVMLFRAASYWVNNYDKPVWLEARGINENVTRYAVIKNGVLDGEGSHWGGSFFQPDCEPVMKFTLAIERGLWQKYPPRQYELAQNCSAFPVGNYGVQYVYEASSDTGFSIDAAGTPPAMTNDWTVSMEVTFPDGEVPLSNRVMLYSVKKQSPALGDIVVLFSIYNNNFEYYEDHALSFPTEVTIPLPPGIYDGNPHVIEIAYDYTTEVAFYIDGVQLTPSSYTFNTNNLGTVTGATMAIFGNGFLAETNEVVNPGVVSWFRWDNTLAVQGEKTTDGDINWQFSELRGPTLDNTGTLGAAKDGTISFPIGGYYEWVTVGNENVPVFGKETCDTNDVSIGATTLPIPITHIFAYQNSVFSANLIDSTPPYELVPSQPIAGDYLYVGSTVGRFTHLTFNLSPSMENNINGGDGTSWWRTSSAYTGDVESDTTRALAVPGVGIVTGVDDSPWTLGTVNGVQAYWWRLDLFTGLTFSGTYVAPQQVDYQVYAANSVVDIPQYNGSASSLARYNFKGASLALRQSLPDAPSKHYIAEIACGYRSLSRGEAFNHVLSAYDSYLPNGISVTTPTGGSVVETTLAPGGWTMLGVERTSPSVYNPFPLATWIFVGGVTKQYAGTYKAYARVRLTTAQMGNMTGRLQATIYIGSTDGTNADTEIVSSAIGKDLLTDTFFDDTAGTRSGQFLPVEIGTVRIPDTAEYNNDSTITIIVGFQHNNDGSGTNGIYISDLILIPTDEYSFFTAQKEPAPAYGLSSYTGDYGQGALGAIRTGSSLLDLFLRRNLLVSSLDDERDGVVSYLYQEENHILQADTVNKLGIRGSWDFNSAFPAMLPNNDGRLYFCYPYQRWDTALQMQVYVNPVYYSLGEVE